MILIWKTFTGSSLLIYIILSGPSMEWLFHRVPLLLHSSDFQRPTFYYKKNKYFWKDLIFPGYFTSLNQERS